MKKEENFESMLLELEMEEKTKVETIEEQVLSRVMDNVKENCSNDIVKNNGRKTFKNIKKTIKSTNTKDILGNNEKIIENIIDSLENVSIVVDTDGEETYRQTIHWLIMLGFYHEELAA